MRYGLYDNDTDEKPFAVVTKYELDEILILLGPRTINSILCVKAIKEPPYDRNSDPAYN